MVRLRAQAKRLNRGRASTAWSRSQLHANRAQHRHDHRLSAVDALILMQTKGSSFTGAFGGDTGSINRTRRGVEKTLFQFTIGTAAVYVLLAIASSFLI